MIGKSRARFGNVLRAFLLLAAILPAGAMGDTLELPETGISYEIEVRLDPLTRDLSGRETIRWTNPSESILDRMPLHLYLNGFSHERTTWMAGVPGGRLDLEELLKHSDDPWGWNEPSSIRRDGVDVAWQPIRPDDGNPLDRSLIELVLDPPVAPGETLELQIEFEARLPVPMARTGGRLDFFVVVHWFPKVAVLETVGVRGAIEDQWNAHQFHGPTEFYADYADYDVRIGLPEGWNVVATGKGGPEEAASADGLVWHRYRQNAVHDFAFSTGSNMVDLVSPHRPKGSDTDVEIHVFVPRGTEHQAERWLRSTRASLDVMSSIVAPFPYETMTVVYPPWWANPTLGMEYPTLIINGPGDPLIDTDLISGINMGELVTAHEFAHQYFYAMVGSNEFEEAYMDEGFTQYWGDRIMAAEYGDEAGVGTILGRDLSVSGMATMSLPSSRNLPQSIWSGDSYLARDGYKFSQFYNLVAATMSTAEGLFGRDTVDKVFAAYFDRWAFRHPRFEDFLIVVREVGGEEFAEFVLEAYTQTRQPDYRIDRMSSERWERPRGRMITPAGTVEPDNQEDALAGLDPAAREGQGLVLAEVHDPGRSRSERGGVWRKTFSPETGEAEEGWEAEEDVFHASRVRVEGAGWDHLPVEVVFRFADGVTLREDWDGHSDYRIYSFVRSAPLSEVVIDPQGINRLDPEPANNSQLLQPDTRLSRDWSRWLGAVTQLLVEGLGLWL
jgi:hypothetical protein